MKTKKNYTITTTKNNTKYTKKNRENMFRDVIYKNNGGGNIEIIENDDFEQEGGGISHNLMMYRFKSILKKVDKTKKNLEKTKGITKTYLGEYKSADSSVIKAINTMYIAQRALSIYEGQLAEYQGDKKKQIFISNAKENINMLNRKNKLNKSQYEKRTNTIKNTTQPKFKKYLKILDKRYKEFNKALDKLVKFKSKYDIELIKERYEATRDISVEDTTKAIKKVKGQYDKYKADYDKILKTSGSYFNDKNKVLEEIEDIKTNAKQYEQNVSGVIGKYEDVSDSSEGLKIEDWKKNSRKFYEYLTKVIGDKKIVDNLTELIRDIEMVRDYYKETNNSYLLNSIVPKYNNVIELAISSKSSQENIKKIMKDLKEDYLKFAPADYLNKYIVFLVQANTESINGLITIKNFLEKFLGEGSYEKGQKRNYVQKGGFYQYGGGYNDNINKIFIEIEKVIDNNNLKLFNVDGQIKYIYKILIENDFISDVNIGSDGNSGLGNIKIYNRLLYDKLPPIYKDIYMIIYYFNGLRYKNLNDGIVEYSNVGNDSYRVQYNEHNILSHKIIRKYFSFIDEGDLFAISNEIQVINNEGNIEPLNNKKNIDDFIKELYTGGEINKFLINEFIKIMRMGMLIDNNQIKYFDTLRLKSTTKFIKFRFKGEVKEIKTKDLYNKNFFYKIKDGKVFEYIYEINTNKFIVNDIQITEGTFLARNQIKKQFINILISDTDNYLKYINYGLTNYIYYNTNNVSYIFPCIVEYGNITLPSKQMNNLSFINKSMYIINPIGIDKDIEKYTLDIKQRDKLIHYVDKSEERLKDLINIVENVLNVQKQSGGAQGNGTSENEIKTTSDTTNIVGSASGNGTSDNETSEKTTSETGSFERVDLETLKRQLELESNTNSVENSVGSFIDTTIHENIDSRQKLGNSNVQRLFDSMEGDNESINQEDNNISGTVIGSSSNGSENNLNSGKNSTVPNDGNSNSDIENNFTDIYYNNLNLYNLSNKQKEELKGKIIATINDNETSDMVTKVKLREGSVIARIFSREDLTDKINNKLGNLRYNDDIPTLTKIKTKDETISSFEKGVPSTEISKTSSSVSPAGQISSFLKPNESGQQQVQPLQQTIIDPSKPIGSFATPHMTGQIPIKPAPDMPPQALLQQQAVPTSTISNTKLPTLTPGSTITADGASPSQISTKDFSQSEFMKKQMDEEAARLKAFLTRPEFDGVTRNIKDIEKRIFDGENGVNGLVKKIKASDENDESYENMIKYISSFIKIMGKIEESFEEFKTAKPINFHLQKWNLLATIENIQYEADDGKIEELRQDLEKTIGLVGKVKMNSGLYGAEDILNRLCQYLNYDDAGGVLLTTSFQDVKKMLEENPSLISEHIYPPGFFSIKQSNCNQLRKYDDIKAKMEEDRKKTQETIREKTNALKDAIKVKDPNVDKDKLNKDLEELAKKHGLEGQLKEIEGIKKKEDLMAPSWQNAGKIAYLVRNNALNIRDKSPQLYNDLVTNIIQKVESKKKDKKDDKDKDKDKDKKNSKK